MPDKLVARPKQSKSSKASKAAKTRVLIARDVIAQLDGEGDLPAKAFRVRDKYGYCYIKPANENAITEDMKKEQLNKLLPTEVKQCNVCAVGALFVCAVMRHNDLTVDRAGIFDSELVEDEGWEPSDGVAPDHPGELFPYWKNIQRYLKKFFTQMQLELIEHAFEPDDDQADDALDVGFELLDPESSEARIAKLYVQMYPKPPERLRAIMQNIVANKGTFVCTPETLQTVYG